MPALVSVIIPTHNRLVSLQAAIASVLAQTYDPLEVIIINDASSDGTAEYLEALTASDSRIQAIHNKTSVGGSQSRNLGIAASRGEWLAFLDDDDIWLPEKLLLQITALQATPGSVACSSSYRVNYPFGVKKIIQPPPAVTWEQLLQANILGGASVCVCRSSVLKALGGFDANLRSAQDWDVWMKLRKEGSIISVSKVLVEYYVHFEVRISNDMRAKYAGARRFYFKYRQGMDRATRVGNIAFLCFIKSRQSKRRIVARWRYLALAMKFSRFATARAYCLSSLPRIVLAVRF